MEGPEEDAGGAHVLQVRRELDEALAELASMRRRLIVEADRATRAESDLESVRARLGELAISEAHHRELATKSVQRLRRIHRMRSWKMTAGLRKADATLRSASKTVARTANRGRSRLDQLVHRSAALVGGNATVGRVLRVLGFDEPIVGPSNTSSEPQRGATKGDAPALSPAATQVFADLTATWSAVQSRSESV